MNNGSCLMIHIISNLAHNVTLQKYLISYYFKFAYFKYI